MSTAGAQPMDRLRWDIRTRGVVTPSDFLSDEQIEKLSGPVRVHVDPSLIRKREPREEKHVSTVQVVEMNRDNFMRLVREGKTLNELGSAFGKFNEQILEFAAQPDWPDEFLPYLQRLIRNEVEPKSTAPRTEPRAETQPAASPAEMQFIESRPLPTALPPAPPAPPTKVTKSGGMPGSRPSYGVPAVNISMPPTRTPQLPELTADVLEAAIKAGKTERECAEIFGVTEGEIKRKKCTWNLLEISPNRRGGRQPRLQRTPEAVLDVPAQAGEVVPDLFTISMRRSSIMRGDAATLLKGLAAYLEAGGGKVSLKLDIEEVTL